MPDYLSPKGRGRVRALVGIVREIDVRHLLTLADIYLVTVGQFKLASGTLLIVYVFNLFCLYIVASQCADPLRFWSVYGD